MGVLIISDGLEYSQFNKHTFCRLLESKVLPAVSMPAYHMPVDSAIAPDKIQNQHHGAQVSILSKTAPSARQQKYIEYCDKGI